MIEKEFVDRVPSYAGRVKLVPVEGEADTYDMIRADEPIIEGTPLDKATFESITKSRLTGRYYVPTVSVNGTQNDFIINGGIPDEWSENQRITVKTPTGYSVDGITTNTINGIAINEILTPDIRYELVYNGTTFDVNKCGAEHLNNTVLNIITSATKTTLLWENASPTSNFAAQTITLASNDWDFLIVETTADTAIISDINITKQFNVPYVENSGVGNTKRDIAVSSKTQVYFSSTTDNSWSYYNESVGTYRSGNYNTLIKPLKIYGVKLGVTI